MKDWGNGRLMESLLYMQESVRRNVRGTKWKPATSSWPPYLGTAAGADLGITYHMSIEVKRQIASTRKHRRSATLAHATLQNILWPTPHATVEHCILLIAATLSFAFWICKARCLCVWSWSFFSFSKICCLQSRYLISGLCGGQLG